MKKTYLLSLVLMLFSLTSCWDSDYQEDFDEIKLKATEADGSDSGSSADKMIGTWRRNDGQAITYLKIDGTTAVTCNNGTKTTGTYKTSVSVTFIVSGVTYVFPLEMQGDKLILMVPSQGNANHIPTEYVRDTAWPCN